MKPLRYALKKEWHNLILLTLPFLIIPFIGNQLPSRIAIHWNLQGQPDGFTTKPIAMLLLPIGNVLIYLLMLYIPKIDPKKRIEIDQKPLPALRTIFVVLFLSIQGILISYSLGIKEQSLLWLYMGLGIFVLVTGNYLRTLKPNYFIGIRLPWTLESSENWKQTHRVGSYTWVAGGLLTIVLIPYVKPSNYSIVLGVIMAFLAIIPAGYSFYYYKASQK